MTKQYQTSIIAGIVALVFLMVMALVGLGVTGRLDGTTTPLILSIFGTATTVIVTLLNIVRTDRVVIEQKKTNDGIATDVQEIKEIMVNGSPHTERSNTPGL